MNRNRSKQTAKIFLNGAYPKEHIDFYLDEMRSDESFLIAVDGGLRLFSELTVTHPTGGVVPDLILGDFDSLDTTAPRPTTGVTTIEIPPENKMFTDCEFALKWCAENGINNVIIYGGIDSSFETDHLLGNILIMFAYKDQFESIKMRDYCQEIIPLEDERYEGDGKVGDFVSLVPLSKEIDFGCTGLKYDPGARVFKFGSSTPLRNQLADTKFTIDLTGRAALVVHF